MCSAHDWLVSVRLSGFGTFCSGAHARITEWLSDFRQHKTLRVSPLVCHFPFLPRQISEKTPGNLAGLWAAKPIALKAAGPRAPWPPAWPGASLRCSPCREHTLPSVLPPPAPAPAPWFHTSVPKLTFSSLSFSFHPPLPRFLFNSRKEFRTHLQWAQYQITLPRRHYMSQCLKQSGWRKTRSDCRHTCVSVHAEASYALGLRRVRGDEVFLWKGSGEAPWL